VAARLDDLAGLSGDPDTAINLLIVERSLNDADNYVSALRNAGLAVHPHRVDKDSELAAALEEKDADLMLCSCGEGNIGLDRVLELIRATDSDVPVLLIVEERSTELLAKARDNGVRDLVDKAIPEHLQLAVAREFHDLLVRRAVGELTNRLSESESRCKALVHSSRDAIAYVHQGMHISANSVYLNLFGFVDMDELEGMSVLDLVDAADHKKLKKVLRSLDGDTDTAELEVRCVGGSGGAFAALLEFSPASIDGEPCEQIVIRDQSHDRELEQKIQALSNLDVLTGLANRNHFIDALQGRLASNPQGAVLYLVMDSFQEARSTAGLAASDGLLKELAELLRDAAGSEDVSARFGDHSFTVLTPRSDPEAIEELAERIRKRVEDHVSASAREFISPTCSIGIATIDGGDAASQDLINHAYQACEAVRKAGGNSWKIFDAATEVPELTAKGADETDLNELIAHALEHDRFRLVYQPIVSLQGDSRENYAVMVRLLDKNDEEILPAHFLEQAKASNQMAAIDRWVVKAAIRELALQRKQGNKINLFVTLSGPGLSDESMLLCVIDALRHENAKGSWLTFQIADEDLRAHIQDAKRLIEGLKKIKCRLAIDHFGVMPKFESLLKHLPVDYVKFDGSFMQGMSNNKARQEELGALSKQVQELGIKTVATWVEDANSLAVLWTIGINYIQGYFLQEPSPTIAFDFEESQ
jgi:diguanylate cyclase (GGDEF)-like protein/PAS domain S-box-containing protein